MKRLILFFIFFLLIQNKSFANCIWQWDCSTNPCQQVPICDSTTDIVPPQPPSVPPIAPPSIKPINPPTVPPIGTTECYQKYICDGDGCHWQQICQ